MAYIVKYIKDFSDRELVKQSCDRELALGYKVMVFSHTDNACGIEIENVAFVFCDNPTEQAILSAKKIYAEKCQFYVKRAIYSVDPNIYDEAVKLKELDYESAQELSVNGYNEISYYDFNLAKRNSVRMEIMSLADSEGTTVKEVTAMDENIIKSMSKDTDILVVTLTEIPDRKGATYNIFRTLSDADVFIDSIMLPAANGGQQDISFCIRREDRKKVEKLLLSEQQNLQYKNLFVSEDVAKISVMGAGFHTQKGIATKVLRVLYESDINIMMIFTSEVKISLVVEKSQADKAIHAIHKNLIGK